MKKLIFALLLLVSGALSAQDNGLFWKVTSPEGKQSYLFGTYHLMGSDFLKEDRPEVLDAFQKADQVIVEMVLDSAKLPGLMPYYMMPEHSLKALVNEEDYFLLKQKLEPLMGAPLAALDHLKPAVLSMTYSLSVMQEAMPDSAQRDGKPMDLFFAEEGAKTSKKVLALESMEEQVKILMNTQSPKEQVDELLKLLKEEEGTLLDAQSLISAYLSDDLEDIQGLGEQYEEENGGMDELVVKRNLNWIPTLSAQLEQGGAFVAVGALHLSGEQGLVSLLRKEGFKLEAL